MICVLRRENVTDTKKRRMLEWYKIIKHFFRKNVHNIHKFLLLLILIDDCKKKKKKVWKAQVQYFKMVSQKFCNVLIMRETISSFRCFCWGYECDELYWILRYQACLIYCKCYSPNMALKFLVLGLPDYTLLLRFLQPEKNFLNHLLCERCKPFTQQMFLVASALLYPSSNS